MGSGNGVYRYSDSKDQGIAVEPGSVAQSLWKVACGKESSRSQPCMVEGESLPIIRGASHPLPKQSSLRAEDSYGRWYKKLPAGQSSPLPISEVQQSKQFSLRERDYCKKQVPYRERDEGAQTMSLSIAWIHFQE